MRRTSQRASSERQPLGLRSRVTVVFSLAGFALSLGLAVFTYSLTRNELLDQRDDSALNQAFANAQVVRDSLSAERLPPKELIESVRTEGSGFALLGLPDGEESETRWFPGDALHTPEDVPGSLLDEVLADTTARLRYDLRGEPYLAVGVSIGSGEAQYVEAFPLAGLERSLRVLLTTLAGGVAITTIAAALVGRSASRRLLRPVSRVADAASDLASGGLDTRLEPEPDPDLDRLVSSFNEMADAVQARIQREARFASDVSHELRSPITALSAAVEVLAARREELQPRSQQALDVVVNQVRRFDQMVLDLLELSRLEAGVDELNPEEVSLPETVHRIAARLGHGGIPIDVGRRAGRPVLTDKRRLERILVNLLENAQHHAGGPVRVALEDGPGSVVRVVVEDAGPGVPPAERDRVFERFFRGTAARRRVGTGLGLALVAEHARALGGTAWVEDRPGGGSRFVVSLPAVAP